jgi:mono/diheme cytochrome c family protein
LLVIIVVGAGVVYAMTEQRLNHDYVIAPETVALPTRPSDIEKGKHVAIISGCVDCHGPNLSGRVFFENPIVGRFAAPNLTPGKGGFGGTLTDQDWIRAIRHGVRPDGKPLLAMPCKEYFSLSDADLGALVAYLKTLPPIDKEVPASQVSPMGRVLMVALKDMPILGAELIDHNAKRPVAPAVGVTKEYGAYLGVRCMGCHGDTLSGGHIPGTPPDWPAAPDLTPYPGVAVATWSEVQFMHAIRTGMTPEGKQLDNKFMPWPVLGQMTDDELKALWLFLKSVPAKAPGNR